jgi:predicted nucleic acid-binding protein
VIKDFFDTSVLVAAFRGTHMHHRASIQLLSTATPQYSACGLHTLAEVYATMTALPVRPMIPPEQAMLLVEEIRNRLSVISLNGDEYVEAIRAAAVAALAAPYWRQIII